MLNDATCFKEVYIVCGLYNTDLRSGMDRLAVLIEAHTENGYMSQIPFIFFVAGAQIASRGW